MKKQISLLLSLALVLSLSVTAFAADGSGSVGRNDSQDIPVTAKNTGSSTDTPVYSVDISWEDMTFTYSATTTRTWNPDTHTYTSSGTRSWNKTTAAVTVVNHSNVDVDVSIEYAGVADTGVTGAMDITSDTLAAGKENKYSEADSGVYTLTISGAPNASVSESGIQIGTITVTIA